MKTGIFVTYHRKFKYRGHDLLEVNKTVKHSEKVVSLRMVTEAEWVDVFLPIRDSCCCLSEIHHTNLNYKFLTNLKCHGKKWEVNNRCVVERSDVRCKILLHKQIYNTCHLTPLVYNELRRQCKIRHLSIWTYSLSTFLSDAPWESTPTLY